MILICVILFYICCFSVSLHQGYKEREIAFRTGGLGRLMQENVYESWVCLDHFCGDPVFCWVYHEIDKVFTSWGTNSEILLVKGL